MSPDLLLAAGLFLPRSPSAFVREFEHFFLFSQWLFIPIGGMAASRGSCLPAVVRLGR